MSDISAAPQVLSSAPPRDGLVSRLNGEWHKAANLTFLVIVLAHWAEHLVQAFQIYALGWPIPESRGVLGHFYPWLVRSELLHYAYALVMLAGLWLLRRGYTGRSAKWWMAAFWIQFWHHIEHGLLQAQAILGANLFDSPVPISLVQLWVPRVELHLFYNTVVFVPMVFAMYHHLFPSAEDAKLQTCSCALHSHVQRHAHSHS